ncbi:caspase family protein [Pannonibacter indicus]|uniref:caspase family protein n=1 Tax=Pannonibacter indicus TaxID=466044 RepID=UPI0035B246B1
MLARALTCLLLILAGISPALAKRVALVMGNGAYVHTVALPNPANDARAMSAKLKDLGFEVVAGYDLDYHAMRRTVAEFAKEARGADVALLFYAGHGMQVGGTNYLVPVDAKFDDETALDFETISADFVLRQMSNDVKVRMVFLDACRDNPLARTLARSMNPSRSAGVGAGLAELKLQDQGGEGSVIAFATSPGDVALDGTGSNSPFTSALLRHIDAPDTPIQTVMTRVTGDVFKETGQKQRPWVNASLIGEVYLNRSAAPANATTETTVSQDAAAVASGTVPASATLAWEREKALWDAAAAGGTVEDYNVYLAAYPTGSFADFARNQIKRIEAANAPASDEVAAEDGTADTGGEAATAEGARTQKAVAASAPSTSAATDDEASWSRFKRREIQLRLNLAGYDSGTPDGVFGARSRAAIKEWQSYNEYEQTGSLSEEEYDLLKEQTQAEFLAATAQQPRPERQFQRPPQQAQRGTTADGSPIYSAEPEHLPPGAAPERDPMLDAAGAALLGGAIGGILNGIRR